MKYTFEIMKEYEEAFRGISVYSVSEDKKLMVDFVALEELEDAQKKIDEAYHKGWEYGKEYGLGEADMRETVSYQKGLDAAWEAAKKLSWTEKYGGYGDCLDKVFDRTDTFDFLEYSPNEAIAKLKAYEEKQKADDQIKVGDEVEVLNSGSKYLIAWFAGTSLCGFAHDGVTCRLQPSDVRKTGRHFDIEKILEEMRE